MSGRTMQVLLSTYNGEKYIGDQLDSILQQPYEHIKVLIRDDGSSDNTVAIIENYCNRYRGRIQLLKGKNIGVIPSFWTLMQQADQKAAYFCFCDQDDVWMSDKTVRAVHQLEKMEQEQPYGITIPAMIFTATQLTDAQLNPTVIWPGKPAREPSFYNALIQNIAVGATVSFNYQTLRLLMNTQDDVNLSNIQMHDWWMYLVISSMGKVQFDPQPSIYYRQHSNNAVGGEATTFQKVKKKWRSYKKHKDQKLLVRQAQEFQKIYGAQLTNQSMIEQLQAFVTPRTDFAAKLKFLRKCRLYRQSFIENLLFRFLIIIGYI
ncbi:glycosyltransferase family 2 protein [Paenibacillus shenyangensis]|uniref:glycosyltransferase family 2 protein n=1 Tax=Paenibacillus sp. A9 TaxID=1284352 RepID=UPI0003829A7D|nr:glycosyltransferase family 2 protein [Paenibacillus sp. A9]